eukprot:3994551-Prymnesium_polylepis.1
MRGARSLCPLSARGADEAGEWDTDALEYDAYDGKLAPRTEVHELALGFNAQRQIDLGEIAKRDTRIRELEKQLAKSGAQQEPPVSVVERGQRSEEKSSRGGALVGIQEDEDRVVVAPVHQRAAGRAGGAHRS